jgi:predicted 2-oxoglutarate/Fe(II)-dependent dioxygenase YbiX
MIKDYNVFGNNVIESLLAEEYEWKKAVYTPPAMKDQTMDIADTRSAEVYIIPRTKKYALLYRVLQDLFDRTNQQYQFMLNGYISVKIQRYTQKDDSFDWHFDEYPEDHNELTRNGVRRLSTSTLFTSDFTGADLMVEDPQGIIHTLDKQVGSAIVFPSTWLHKVSKLESGERYVLTAWAFGDI